MKAIDHLKDAEVLALARFISGCRRIRGTTHWRALFADCASRNNYLPFVSSKDARHLRELHIRRGTTLVCALRTEDVMEEGNAVAGEWLEAPLAGSPS